MTHVPKTREAYQAAILEQVARLMSCVLCGQSECREAEALARQIHSDVREFFDVARWKPTPVYEGVRAHVPLHERVTLLIRHHDGQDGHTILRGQVTEIGPLGHGQDGAAFGFVPHRHRKTRRLYYRPEVPGASLKVYRGLVGETAVGRLRPLFENEARPRHDKAG